MQRLKELTDSASKTKTETKRSQSRGWVIKGIEMGDVFKNGTNQTRIVTLVQRGEKENHITRYIW